MRWDYCYPIHEEQEIYVPPIGSPEWLTGANKDIDYRGSQSRTRSGRMCQNWASSVPHTHDYSDNIGYQETYGLRSNFCRNPEGLADTIWCYTTDPDKKWEYCDEVSYDDIEGLWGQGGSEYNGAQNLTRSGTWC